MNIKEKARELGKKHARQYRHNNPDVSGDEFVFSDSEIERACNEMGEAVLEAVCGLIDSVNFHLYERYDEIMSDWLVEDIRKSFYSNE